MLSTSLHLYNFKRF